MLSCCAAGRHLSWARSGLGPNFAGNLLHCTANYFGQCTGAPGGHIPQRPCDSRSGCYGIFGQDRADHSALMLADRITLPHFSVSSAINFPNWAGDPGSATPPRSARRPFILASARAALTSVLSLSTISAGVSLGAPRPYHVVAS